MDMIALLLSYSAAAAVSVGVIAAFSSSIDQMLFRLMPSELGPHWTRYVKFALFVASFAGGLPAGGRFDRSPDAPPMPAPDAMMMVMGSAVGSLMAASWLLLIVFGAALAAVAIGKGYAELRKVKEEPQPGFQDDEPVRRKEPAEPRPVQREKPAIQR